MAFSNFVKIRSNRIAVYAFFLNVALLFMLIVTLIVPIPDDPPIYHYPFIVYLPFLVFIVVLDIQFHLGPTSYSCRDYVQVLLESDFMTGFAAIMIQSEDTGGHREPPLHREER